MTKFLEEMHTNANFERIVDLVTKTTGNYDKKYARAICIWGVGLPMSCMHFQVHTEDKGDFPISNYVFALAQSGYGKTFTVNTLEDLQVSFKKNFTSVMTANSARQLSSLANRLSFGHNTTPDEELTNLKKAYFALGPYPMVFDSGTAPAVKQLVQKIQMSNAGSINLVMDEIGANMVDNTELYNTLIELWDKGLCKQKLTKNTTDSKRLEDLIGIAPANVLGFGNPSKVFDGGPTEACYFSTMKMGYYRRSIFACGENTKQTETSLSAEELYHSRANPQNNIDKQEWIDKFGSLADGSLVDFKIQEPEDVGILRTEYMQFCNERASHFNEYEEDKRVELQNRWGRVLRVAGELAVLDALDDMDDFFPVITRDNLLEGIYYIEEASEAFYRLLVKEPIYAKTVKYLASVASNGAEDVYKGHDELAEVIPGYKVSNTWIKTNTQMAKSWGLTHGYLVTSKFDGNIEFLGAKLLNKTSLNAIKVSVSDKVGTNYQNAKLPFTGEKSSIEQLCKADSNGDEGCLHFINHFSVDGRRREDSLMQGFNCIVLDCDGDCSIKSMESLLEGITYMLYTTKRHQTPEGDFKDRFRVIIPINYELYMDASNYKEFIQTIIGLFPFAIDDAVCQRAHKWQTNPKAQVITHIAMNKDKDNPEPVLFDVLPYIPHSKKCDERESELKGNKAIKDLDKLEMWIYQSIKATSGTGERNKHLFRYGMALRDGGNSMEAITRHMRHLNSALDNPLPDEEVKNIIESISRR